MDDRFARQCADLPDGDLRRILTRDRDDYDLDFLDAAERELAARGRSLDFADGSIRLASTDGIRELMLADAVLHLARDAPLWDPVTLERGRGESCVVQRDRHRWVVHCYPRETYAGSRFCDNPDDLAAALAGLWDPGTHAVDLDRWEAIARVRSARLAGRICVALDDASILNTVRDADIEGGGTAHAIIVAPEEVARARPIAEDIHRRLHDLYRRAETLAEDDDRSAEIAIYDLLADLVPDNLAVFYNRGAARFEVGDFAESAVDFARALELANASRRTFGRRRRSDPWGGLLSGGAATGDVHPALPDIHGYARRLVERDPESDVALRACADAARLRGRIVEARTCYRRLLARTDDAEASAFLQLLSDDE